MSGAHAHEPLVSVIVPIYNTRDFVAECIESLKRQTLDDFQAICVDDASEDGSLACAQRAAGGDVRFNFARRPHGGLSATRNYGTTQATGRYIMFLDSDDLLVPDALEKLAHAARENDADVVDFTASTFFESDEVRQIHDEDYLHRTDLPGPMSGPDLFVRAVENGQMTPSACLHFIRRDLLESAGLSFVEGLLHEDEVFTPLLYAQAKRAVFLNEPLYRRRLRRDSIMTKRRTIANVDAYFRVTQLLHAWIVEHAEDYSPAFIDAWTRNIAHLCDYNFTGFADIPDEELHAYVDSLSAQDRISFNLHVRYALVFAQMRYDDVASSRAFKLGQSARSLLNRTRGK